MTKAKTASVSVIVVLGILVASCQPREIEVTRVVTEKETVLQTVIETVSHLETVVEVVTASPEPERQQGRTLVMCLAQEPDTLFSFYPFGTIVEHEVQAAIYDGPIDARAIGYQPVILEKMPSLDDGDAVIQNVLVAVGDRVVTAENETVVLEEGVVVRPAGCRSADCAVTFDGTPLEMEQMVATFKLKPGITWSDGEPLTASDSVYAFGLYADPDSPPIKYIPDATASYVAPDDLTAVWTGLPGFRDNQFVTWFFEPRPEHAWGGLTVPELLEAEVSSRKPLGWGPYVIDEWVPGDHISLHKNERYWRADEGLPKFDRLIYRFTDGSPGAGLAALLSGECDVVDRVHAMEDYELLLELQAKGQINAIFTPGGWWEHADFGIQPAESYERPDFFGDVRTRQAIAHCMDRQAIVDEVLSGQSVVLDTFLLPNDPLYNPDVRRYPFDVAQGSALLDEVGWIDDDGDPSTPCVARGVKGVPNGTPLEFNYWTTTNYHRQQAAQLLKASLAQCGIVINLEYWNPRAFFSRSPEAPVIGRRFDMVQFAWGTRGFTVCSNYQTWVIPGDAEAVDENGLPLHPFGWNANNNTGFSNPAFDADCNTTMAEIPGTPAYYEATMEVQRIFAEELPVVPLYAPVKVVATHPDLIGLVQDPTDVWEFSSIEEIDIAD